MGLVHTDNLAEGMILSADIHDRSGRMLLAEGAELTMRHIRMFMTWGIHEVDISGVDTPDANVPVCEDIDPEMMQKAEAEFRPLFRNADLEHPAMAELFRLCLIRKVRNEN